MVDITYIDHVEAGLSLLPSQWEDKPVIKGVLAAWLKPLNTIETQALGVRDGFNVNTAIGAQLDIIGQYFNEARAGRTDEDYRNAILSIIASSNGSGTPPQLQSLYQTLTLSESVKLWEHYPLSISLLATGGKDVSVKMYDYMKDASAAAVDYAALMFDPFEWGWIPNDSISTLANVITQGGDNVIIDTGDNVVAEVFVEDVDNGSQRSSFIDETIPDPEEVGYGKNYGNYYGGAKFFTSQFVETSIRGNPLTPSGGNGFVPWATEVEYDPETGTTNKAIPIKQFMDSGLKRKQTMPRQFFNWMMACIDDWLAMISERSSVNNIQMTVDATKTAADYETAFGGTWVDHGSESFTMTSTGQPELVYIFERTA